MPDLAAHLNERSGSLNPKKGLVKRALREGKLVTFSGGNRSVYAAKLATSLADVLELAKSCVDDRKADTRVGRRGGGTECRTSNFREVRWLSKGQLHRATTAARGIAKSIDPDRDPFKVLKAVRGPDLLWSARGGPGDLGCWRALEDHVEQAFAGRAENTIQGYKGALAQLMFLAATRGWVRGREIHDETFDRIPSEWADTWNRWRDVAVSKIGKKDYGVSGGLRWLFLGLLEFGVSSPDMTFEEWETMIPMLEDFLASANLSTKRKSAVRAVHRALVAGKAIDAPIWDARKLQSDGLTILGHTTCHKLAHAYGSERAWLEARQDREAAWEGFPTKAQALRHPLYGLPAVLGFYCVPYGDAESYGLPSRGIGRSRNGGHATGLATGTVNSYLSHLGQFLGLWSRTFGTDWAEEDLRALCDPDRIVQFFHMLIRGELAMSRQGFKNALRIVGRIASPVITHGARQEKESHPERAEQLDALLIAAEQVSEIISAKQFTRVEGGAPTEGLLHRIRRSDGVAEQRSVARDVERAWTSGSRLHDSAKFSYEAIFTARQRLDRRLLAGLRVESWSDLVMHIAGGRRVDTKEAVAIRDSLQVAILQVVPMRRKTLASLKARWITRQGKLVRLSVRDYAIKGDRAKDKRDIADEHPEARWTVFNLADREPKEQEVAEREEVRAKKLGVASLFDLALLDAYMMPGGARSVLEEALGVKDSPYLWLPERWDQDRPPVGEEGSAPRLTPGNVTERIAGFQERASRALGIQKATFQGIAPLHSFRHSYGTFYVRNNHPRMAQHYLCHTSLDMLLKIYADEDASSFVPATVGARLLGSHNSGLS